MWEGNKINKVHTERKQFQGAFSYLLKQTLTSTIFREANTVLL
jgi:hypothetical protein